MERQTGHWCLPEFRRRKHPTVALFSPFFSGKTEKKVKRVRNDHDGTNPRKRRSYPSVLVSSFPNRKLNLWLGFRANSDNLLGSPFQPIPYQGKCPGRDK